VRKATAWRVRANEYSTRSTSGAVATQVGSQSFADIRRQRHPVVKQPLAPNEDFAGSPVDVLELKTDHFPGAKPQAGQ
jgi:hypothetical protein